MKGAKVEYVLLDKFRNSESNQSSFYFKRNILHENLFDDNLLNTVSLNMVLYK